MTRIGETEKYRPRQAFARRSDFRIEKSFETCCTRKGAGLPLCEIVFCVASQLESRDKNRCAGR